MRSRDVTGRSRTVSGRWVIALALGIVVAAPTVAVAQSLDELRRDLDEARDEAGQLDDRLGGVRSQISATEQELAELAVRLDDARARLEAAEGQVVLAEEALLEAQEEQEVAEADHRRAEQLLVRTEQELADEEDRLAEQLVESFKYGTVGATRGAMVIEVLRRAEDPNGFAVGMKQLKVVVDTQEATVQRVFDLRDERAELADDAARARSRAVQAANEAASTLAVVEDLREQAAELADQVAAEEARQRTILDSLRTDAAETEALLQRVESRQRELRAEYDKRRAEEALQIAAGSGSAPPIDGYCPVQGAIAGRDFINDWGFPRSGGRSHQGNDIFAAKGTPVVAIQGGTVVRINPPSRPTRLGGITVTYRTADGSEWYNAHLDTIASGISVGTSVSAGQQIGTVGQTGNAAATPPHLHLGRKYGGSWVNPWPAMSQIC